MPRTIATCACVPLCVCARARSDGFHNYLLAGFVSCNHQGVVPEGRTILGAQLRLRANRIFGDNPFIGGNVVLRTDMVRAGPGMGAGARCLRVCSRASV
jgi:hypothetical protein